MSQAEYSFIPLDLSMADVIAEASYGNVADYFSAFADAHAAERWIEKALAEIAAGEKVEFALYLEPLHEFAGLVSLRDLKTKAPEFGLWIHPQHQGKGLGKRSLQWLIEWAREHTEAEYLIYDAEKENQASNTLACAAGLKREREYEEDGKKFFRYTYSIGNFKDSV